MAQPPFGQPTQQPPYGYPQQPPYGPPQQPPYGHPQQPFGPGDDYPPMMPPATGGKRRNGFAVTGIVLAILIWPLGLIFSIIGLVKSKARAGAGQALSIVGIVVALIVGTASVAFVAVAANSPAADPGCITAENDISAMLSKFTADDNAISRDTGNSSAERADIQRFGSDAQTLQSKLSAAEAGSQHPAVRAKIGAMTSDLGVMTSSLQAVEHGDTSRISDMNTAAGKLQGDGAAIDSICSTL